MKLIEHELLETYFLCFVDPVKLLLEVVMVVPLSSEWQLNELNSWFEAIPSVSEVFKRQLDADALASLQSINWKESPLSLLLCTVDNDSTLSFNRIKRGLF